MSSQLLVRVDQTLKNKINTLAHAEGKTISQLVRELLENYALEHDRAGYIADLWQRIGGKLRAKGKKASDIARAIRAVREEKRK